MDVNLKGDAQQTLEALIPLLQRKTDRGWQETIIENVRDWWETIEGRAHTEGNNGRLNPERVFWESAGTFRIVASSRPIAEPPRIGMPAI